MIRNDVNHWLSLMSSEWDQISITESFVNVYQAWFTTREGLDVFYG